ncbi:hypothetical protein FRC05_007939 [Tulasnella sp. 425]|nr:hypothetical protein FRC05_007939 [Tulasnella sp. 425]
MSTLTPHPPTSTPNPPGAFKALKLGDATTNNDTETTPNVHYWSGLLLSRQLIPYQVSTVGEPVNNPTKTLGYGAITAMGPFQNSSFEELRVAYYFYDLKPNGSKATASVTSSKRSWETPSALSIPRKLLGNFTMHEPLDLSTFLLPLVQGPPPSQSTSAFTAVFPGQPPPSTPISTQTPRVSVTNGPPESPFAAASNQLFGQATRATEAPPIQAFAALGLSSRPTTPARPLAGRFTGQPTTGDLVNFPRSPAAERIPAVNTAETEWEAARRAVAWRKTVLEQAQAEYDESVRAEREKFKAYSAARMNFDK